MTTSVLHLLAGPNGSGKTTFYERVIAPATRLPFINADEIAKLRWPGEELLHGHDAAEVAAQVRADYLAAGTSFATETVFSHPSKVDMLRAAAAASYQVTLHVMMIPVELAVARVALRVDAGGHDVPEDKIRARYDRLWRHIVEAVAVADGSKFYDNSNAEHAYRIIGRYDHGQPTGSVDWPSWAPATLQALPT